jgi:hypothetical protein
VGTVNLADAIRNATPNIEGGFKHLPLGEHDVICCNAEFSHSKTNDNPMFKLTFVVEDGPLKGRKEYSYASITTENVDRSVGVLIMLGAEQSDIALAAGEEDDAAKARVCGAVIDSEATLKVVKGTGDYQGEPNVGVWVNPRKGSTPRVPEATGKKPKSGGKSGEAPF